MRASKYENVKEKIRDVCLKLGISESRIQIVAVSKKQTSQAIKEIYGLGQKDFAENYLQECDEKMKQLESLKLRWHFIGQIQTKKIPHIVGRFELVQSIGSLKTLEKYINVLKTKRIQDSILLQVNIANEATKSGFNEGDLKAALEICTNEPLVACKGLMVFPPLEEKESAAKKHFDKGFSLFEKWRSELAQESFSILSMGTSTDYFWAIECGSNMVRIGTEIFGEREV